MPTTPRRPSDTVFGLGKPREYFQADAGAELPRLPRPVGEPGGVAEVDVVLLRQGDQALVQDGEAADAGVEHRDRQRGVAHMKGL